LRRVRELLRFGAAVTVISPTLCDELAAMSEDGRIRHIPRKYFRGDCSNSQLCVAATDNPKVNVDIATESKAKNIPIHVTAPSAYGNFQFPYIAVWEDMILLAGDTVSKETLRDTLPELLRQLEEDAED
jgi:siroheme synthase-like protein